jgi:hypothetical protein
LKAGLNSFCEARDRGRLRKTGNTFNQQMAVRQQANQHAMNKYFLSNDRVADLGHQPAKRLTLNFDFLRKLLELSVSNGRGRCHGIPQLESRFNTTDYVVG